MPSDSQLPRNLTAAASTRETSPSSSTTLGTLAEILCFQFTKVLRSNSPDQLDSRAVLDKSLLNLQRHACSLVQSAGRSEVLE
jgi:hypothetical protein